MSENKKVLFDPGYAPIVIDSLGQVGYTYYIFSVSKDVRIKKINFPKVLKKLEDLLKINLSFYLGCLMWASCIAPLDNYEIEGNKLLGDNATEEEYTSEINFLIELVEKGLNRDSKYYLNKPYEADSRYLPILKTYKDFLIINKGFTSCKLTNQIVLPENLKKLNSSQIETLKEKINTAINSKDVTLLLEDFDLIF